MFCCLLLPAAGRAHKLTEQARHGHVTAHTAERHAGGGGWLEQHQRQQRVPALHRPGWGGGERAVVADRHDRAGKDERAGPGECRV